MNKYKVYFNRKDNIKEVLNERIKDSLCHIIWLNKELSDSFNGSYIPNIHEVKRKYSQRTYFYYPIKVINNTTIVLCDETEEVQGYIIVSKRDYKMKYPHLRYEKTEIIKMGIDKIVYEFLTEINTINNEKAFYGDCIISDSEGAKIDELDDIIACNTEQLKNILCRNTSVIDSDYDEYIKNLSLDYLWL